MNFWIGSTYQLAKGMLRKVAMFSITSEQKKTKNEIPYGSTACLKQPSPESPYGVSILKFSHSLEIPNGVSWLDGADHDF